MHRISSITTWMGRVQQPFFPPLAPRKNCKLGALTIPWRGNLRFTKTNIWSLLPLCLWKMLILSRLLFFKLRERRKSASCCKATNWVGCSNWWQYSRFMTSWSCSAYFRSNFKHIYFVKDANYDMNEIIPFLQTLLHTLCWQNPRKQGLNARESDWSRTLSINEIVPR